MTRLGRTLVVLVGAVFLGAFAWACSAREAPVNSPAPLPSARAEPPSPAPATTQPSAPPPPSPTAPAAAASDAANCAIVAGPGEPIATVALGERVDPGHAPFPTNDSERLLFRQLYEPLVRLDCNGRIAPGVAESWRPAGNAGVWTVTLRERARFADGSPVTAAAAIAGWTVAGGGSALRPQVSRLIQSATALDERTLVVALRRHAADAPVVLAHADLAIVARTTTSQWPLGTRSARALPDAGAPAAATRPAVTIERDDLPPVRFVVSRGDPRDLLDSGADLLLTRDPAALAYAATLPPFQSVPLDWQRVHVLLAPVPSSRPPSLSDDARMALARDAVRGEARGAIGPFWWEALTDCEMAAPWSRERPSFATRIVHDAADRTAREIAERLVGLGRASTPAAAAILDGLLPDRPRRTYERAVGLTDDTLLRARRLGNDAGYIVALDRRPLDPCGEMEALTASAPWLDPPTIVPLVETRVRAIVRRGRTGLVVDGDGGLLLDPRIGPR